MKALALALLFVTSSAFASIVPTNNVTVATDFQITTAAGKTIKQTGTMIVDPTQHKWVTMVKPQEGVALLGRVAKLEGKVATMEFMVVDTNKTDALNSNPRIITQLGKQAVIAEGPQGSEPTMKIAVTVEKTR